MSLSSDITETRFKAAHASFCKRARLVKTFPAERLFALSGRADVRASNTGVHGDEEHFATCTITILSAGVNDCDPLTKVQRAQERECEAQRGRPLMCCYVRARCFRLLSAAEGLPGVGLNIQELTKRIAKVQFY